jgi:hypothetical protein
MFMNELSFSNPAPDVRTGQNRVKQFIAAIKESSLRGVKRKIHLPSDYLSLPITTGYSLRHWLGDERVDVELRRYFKSLATSVPFLNSEPEKEKIWEDTDCFWHNLSTLGLKAAYVADGLAISIPSADEWNSHFIECIVHEISNDDVIVHTEPIHHISTLVHVESHTQWIKKRIQNAIENGKDLWDHIIDFFPLLIFCANVEKQMCNLPNESLERISKGLFYLNTYCRSWKTGSFDISLVGCRITPESQSTLQKFHKDHSFLCPDGQDRLFSLHVKLGDKWRIYFNTELGPGALIIGHVGDHLPIVTNPT